MCHAVERPGDLCAFVVDELRNERIGNGDSHVERLTEDRVTKVAGQVDPAGEQRRHARVEHGVFETQAISEQRCLALTAKSPRSGSRLATRTQLFLSTRPDEVEGNFSQ